MMQSLPLAFCINFILGGFLGAVGGLFGIGGGLIGIPVLGLLYAMDQQLAQGTALVMIVPNVLIGFLRYKQRNNIAWRDAIFMAVPCVLTTYVAARVATSIEARSLHVCFAAFMVLLALYFLWTLLRRQKDIKPRKLLPERSNFLVGIVAGATSGFFSIGGAIVAVPGLVAFYGVTQTAAQGLALAMVAPGTLVALWAYASADHVNWSVGIPMALGGMLTVSWGVALAHHLPERRLRMLFCAALIAIALWMIVHG